MDVLPTKFVTEPSSSLKCPMCGHLFREPVISTCCGHTFCRICVNGPQSADKSKIMCPVDAVVMNSDNFVPNRAVQGQLEDLLIFCRHGLYRVDSDEELLTDEEGCKEHIPFGRRHEHEENCLSAWIPCPNSSNYCGMFRRRDFEQHLQMCTHVPCQFKEQGSVFLSLVEMR